ncbi:aminoglycoside phosphotransferase family protein [Haloterrigena sp. SYSU A121-1]|uniref:Aminoglycoside phosphotransferase family protein n=1 Tax=Haloterrigena gelatinilytica TaxID=2741724 RepID=A0A8J8KJG3_9EURY|nr:aminoglycoside phosphotransferase family protein [Haloterrigena gelatinilytica]NUB93329.1 aminoglycoside phosphotransferase family protein [Haloterrigena gelatinilytica]
MGQILSDALERAFPDRNVSEIDSPSESQHPGNQTYRISFSNGEQAYLKLVTDGGIRRIRRAGAVLRYLNARAEIRVPRVLSARVQSEPYYLATTALSGEPIVTRWSGVSTAKRESMLYQVGQAIANLHSVRFEESGRILGGTADNLSLEEGPWVTVLCNTIEERVRTVFSDRFKEFPNLVQQVLKEHREGLTDVPVSLLHGDPNRKNCLVQSNDSTVGLVDWEESLVGDPSFDLCRVEATQIEQPPVHDPDRLRRALRAGYRNQAGSLPEGYEKRIPLYRIVTFLKPAQTFEFWAPEADEPVPELATWIRDEMQRRITALESDN